MTPQMFERLFAPFTQSEDAVNRRFGGTGLGLTIAKSLIDMMNGTIEVQSEKGVGSVFTITLNFKHAPKSKEVPIQIQSGAAVVETTGTRVLVVEDNAVNRMVIERQLLSLGYSPDVAEDGKKGLERWRTGDYAMILSDCHMPVMNGFEMTGEIRREENERGLKRTPIIAITANALQGEAELCYAAGMDAYLSKPVRLEDMKKTLLDNLPQTQE